MSIDYKLYNIKSDIYQNSIPQNPGTDEIWIRFPGVVGIIYYQVENYNKHVWIRFNSTDLNRTYTDTKVGANLFDVSPGIISPATNGENIPPGSLLLAVATIPGNIDIQSIIYGNIFVYTRILTDQNNTYRLLVPNESLVYLSKGSFVPITDFGRQSIVNTNNQMTAFNRPVVNSNNQIASDLNIPFASNSVVNSNNQVTAFNTNLPSSTNNDDKFLGYFVHYHTRG